VPSDLIVRRAEPADFDAWFELFEEVAAEGTGIAAELPVDRERLRASFHGTLENEHAARFVALIDGEVVGELGVFDHYGVPDLGMMVRDGHRGQGVGTALLQACIDWARAAGAYKVTLAVFPHNVAGLALYCKHGFVEEGRLVRHYRRRSGELWDAIPMGLVLDHTSPGSSLADAPDR
jgi:RimJ/RimL family protein N-acetyltransferase